MKESVTSLIIIMTAESRIHDENQTSNTAPETIRLPLALAQTYGCLGGRHAGVGVGDKYDVLALPFNETLDAVTNAFDVAVKAGVWWVRPNRR